MASTVVSCCATDKVAEIRGISQLRFTGAMCLFACIIAVSIILGSVTGDPDPHIFD